MAFQVADVLEALPMPVEVLRADGGAAANPFLMQFQADILGCRIEVAAERDSTALGAAALSGLATGVWRDTDSLRSLIRAGARWPYTSSPFPGRISRSTFAGAMLR